MPHRSPPVAPPSAYREHAPPPALRPFVACLWTRGESVDAPPASAPVRVLPDGCVDVMLTLRDGRPSATAIGAMTRAALVPTAPGTRVIAARLRPGAARRLLGLPAAELTDAARPLLDLWPEADALLDAAAAPDALARLTDALALRAARSAPPPLPVRGAIAALERADGALRVDDLAPTVGVTRQALARAFAEHVGVSPKVFARVVRMRRALAHVDAARRLGWSRVALDVGYHDQAHLTRELRALTGRTPGEWSGGMNPG